MQLYKTFLLSCLFLIGIESALFSQINTRAYLLGNLAEVHKDSPFFVHFKDNLSKVNEPFAVIVNGDVSAKDLSKKENWEEDSIKIARLVAATAGHKNGKLVFIPGDRDWLNDKKHGYENVELLEKLIKSFDVEHVIFDPDNGCPGPKAKQIGKDLLVVSINTQWWNNPKEKPLESDAECEYTTHETFLEEVGDFVKEAEKNVILAGHFPLESVGDYGARNSLRRHLFPLTGAVNWLYVPLPIIGTIYASYRQQGGGNKSINNPHFNPIRNEILELFYEFNSVVYTSGHEFNMEITRFENSWFINSGSLGEAGFAGNSRNTLYAKRKKGLVELQYMEDGSMHSIIHHWKDNKLTEIGRYDLLASGCKPNESDIPINQKLNPCEKEYVIDTTRTTKDYGDTTVIASKNYQAGPLKKIFWGKRYRSSWEKEITVPILNLDTTFGGLTPYKRGGGRQTVSLKFEAGNGQKYTFRSVDKDPTKALSYELRKTGAAKLVVDQTAGQQPYGAVSAHVFLDELDILHPKAVVYVMPDDERLGEFREEYAGMVGMLEEDPKDDGTWGADDIEKSNDMFQKVMDDHDYEVDSREYLLARTFDIFSGDWGKHADNWKWAEFKGEEKTIFRPIPRDRDHIYSKWDGVFPYIITRAWAKGTFSRFESKFENIEILTWPARHLDRFVLIELDRKDWVNILDIFNQEISNDVIEKAVYAMPEEVNDPDLIHIEAQLKKRKIQMREVMTKFYEFLAEEVDVVGSDKKEYFQVQRNDDKTVEVWMYNVKDGTEEKGEKLLYYRKFHVDETREIRLFGLGKDDVYNITGNGKKSIKIKVIPGPGEDIITDNSNARGLLKQTVVYERNKNAKLNLGKEGRLVKHQRDYIYDYHRKDWKKNRYFPLPTLSYNPDNGFGIGMGVRFTRFKFGKPEYTSKHTFSGDYTTKGFYGLKYDGRWHHAFKRWDLLAGTSYSVPDDRNFFYGLGNETTKNDSLRDLNYYQTRRTSFKADFGIARNFLQNSEFILKAHYENNENEFINNTNIFDSVNVVGEAPTNLIEGITVLDLNFLDNSTFPKRGTRITASHTYGEATKSDATNSTKYNLTEGSFSLFATTRNQIFPLTLGLKVGGATVSGTGIPYYKRPFLGQNGNLKGFRRNRFTGDASAYANAEARIKLFDVPNGFVPYEFGITGFYDYGRVYYNAENSNKWHTGYGGGIYLLPYSQSFTLSLSVGMSEEEDVLILFGLGTLLNK